MNQTGAVYHEPGIRHNNRLRALRLHASAPIRMEIPSGKPPEGSRDLRLLQQIIIKLLNYFECFNVTAAAGFIRVIQ